MFICMVLLSTILLLSGCQGGCYPPPPNGSGSDPCFGQGTCPDGSCRFGGVCPDVEEPDEPPVITPPISDIYIDEDSGGFSIDLGNYEQAEDNQIAGWAHIGGDPSLFSISISADDFVNLIPEQDAFGQTSVTFVLSDVAGLSSQQTVSIFIRNINDDPVILSDAPTTATVDQEYLYSIIALDVDGDILIYGLTRKPSGMTIDGSGTIRWTPLPSGDCETVLEEILGFSNLFAISHASENADAEAGSGSAIVTSLWQESYNPLAFS